MKIQNDIWMLNDYAEISLRLFYLFFSQIKLVQEDSIDIKFWKIR